ncbi:MAB_1171c family putative transporter [Streptomyces sp. NPDC004539]|uniref:MAB_1171c family putative transporter n=1 Tax=Streptomyces sp. NPDC004539 TaxID=3154280 RepID=UPI0033B16D02
MSNAIVAGLLWCAALWRLPTIGRTRKQTAWAGTLLLIALAMSFEIPAVAHYTNTLFRIHSVSSLIEHVAAFLSAVCLLNFVIAVVQPARRPSGRARIAGRTLTVAALTLTFFLSDRPEIDSMPFKNVDGHFWPSAHAVTFELSLGVTMFVASRLFLGAIRETEGRWLRNGLLLLGIGTSLGAVYALQKTLLVYLRLADITPPISTGGQNAIAVALRSAALLLIVVGQALPLLPASARTYHQYTAWRRLRPLWKAVARATPHVVLRREPVLSPELWLHRRVIEICDGQLTLREWVTEADVLASPLAQAQREAAWMRLAIERKAAGLPSLPGPHPELGNKGLAPAEELRWLVSLSDAMKHPTPTQLTTV